jgi:low affinity Fe/Cu permease
VSEPGAVARTTSQLIAHLQGLTVGDLDALRAKLDEGIAASRALGHEEVALVLDDARRSLARGDLKTFRKRVETAVARLGHLR